MKYTITQGRKQGFISVYSISFYRVVLVLSTFYDKYQNLQKAYIQLVSLYETHIKVDLDFYKTRETTRFWIL